MKKILKIKTYVLTVSLTFPIKHSKAGQPTYFKDHIINAIYEQLNPGSKADGMVKLHTIRSNYPLWKKRIEEVKEGLAVLSIRYWSVKPYNSKQVEVCTLDKDSGIGVQDLYFENGNFVDPFISAETSDNKTQTYIRVQDLAANDGLSYSNFHEWFIGYDLSEPMAIIHFTKFRY